MNMNLFQEQIMIWKQKYGISKKYGKGLPGIIT
jgi:hypothetical protein